MTDAVDERPARRPREVRTAIRRWGDGVVVLVATVFALFLGLPVAILIVRAVADGRSRSRLIVRGRAHRALAEPGDDHDQPRR